MLADETKFCPIRVNVKAAPPAEAELGLSETMAGTGFDCVVWPPVLPEFALPPPPQAVANSSKASETTTNNRRKTVTFGSNVCIIDRPRFGRCSALGPKERSHYRRKLTNPHYFLASSCAMHDLRDFLKLRPTGVLTIAIDKRVR